jgi:hypothetical protein
LAHSLLFAFRRRHPGSRTSTSASVTVAAVVLAGVGACYTGPINMAPSIKILVEDPSMLVRGSDIRFRAEVSDPDNPDNESLKVTWSHSEGDCSDTSSAPRTPGMGMSYTVPGSYTGTDFCVRATVTDGYGAIARDEHPVRPDNQPPTIHLLVEGEDIRSGGWKQQDPFSLFRWIRFDATGTTDPDDGEGSLSFEWATLPPAQPLVECPSDLAPFGPSICAKPTQPGPLTVQLTVRDSSGKDMKVTRTVTVAEDGFPCLFQSTPDLATTAIFSAPDQAQTFTVMKVVDDGDPYDGDRFPATQGNDVNKIFTWFLGTADPLERQADTAAYFRVPPGRFFLGDKARVRVEITDRNTMRSRDALASCKDDICAAVPTCRQRMTWLIDYRQ